MFTILKMLNDASTKYNSRIERVKFYIEPLKTRYYTIKNLYNYKIEKTELIINYEELSNTKIKIEIIFNIGKIEHELLGCSNYEDIYYENKKNVYVEKVFSFIDFINDKNFENSNNVKEFINDIVKIGQPYIKELK